VLEADREDFLFHSRPSFEQMMSGRFSLQSRRPWQSPPAPLRSRSFTLLTWESSTTSAPVALIQTHLLGLRSFPASHIENDDYAALPSSCSGIPSAPRITRLSSDSSSCSNHSRARIPHPYLEFFLSYLDRPRTTPQLEIALPSRLLCTDSGPPFLPGSTTQGSPFSFL